MNSRNRRKSIPELTAMRRQFGVDASKSTVRCRLQTAGLHGRKAVKKPLLTHVHHAKRLEFAHAHSNWTRVDWSSILWTDKSRFTLFRVMVTLT